MTTVSPKLMRSKQSTGEHKGGGMPFLPDGHMARFGHPEVTSDTIHPSRSSPSSSIPLFIFFTRAFNFRRLCCVNWKRLRWMISRGGSRHNSSFRRAPL